MIAFLLAMGGEIDSISGARAIIEPILLILIVLLAIAMVIIVLKQKGDPESLGAITGTTETFHSKNKSKSREGIFKKATIWVAASLVVVSIVYFLLQTII